MAADRKVCYALGNYVKIQLVIIRRAVIKMKAARAKFIQMNPDTTGTPLDNNGAQAISDMIDDLDTEANDAVANAVVASARRSISALGEF